MHWFDPDHLDAAAQAIDAGELVVLPTHRWYMLCADATNTDACGSIYDAKQRSRSKPLALIARSATACEKLFQLTPQARALAARLWPGDLALMLPWRDLDQAAQCTSVGSPALVTHDPGVLGQVALRCSTLVAATAVSFSGAARDFADGPAITPTEVDDFLLRSGATVALAIDGGICPAGQHLTVVDCTSPTAEIVRTGVVHERAVSAALTTI